jgi:hypothetical protein
MIRTLDANYLSTFHQPRPASGPTLYLPLFLSGLLSGYYGFCWGLVEDYRLRPTTTHHRQAA